MKHRWAGLARLLLPSLPTAPPACLRTRACQPAARCPACPPAHAPCHPPMRLLRTARIPLEQRPHACPRPTKQRDVRDHAARDHWPGPRLRGGPGAGQALGQARGWAAPSGGGARSAGPAARPREQDSLCPPVADAALLPCAAPYCAPRPAAAALLSHAVCPGHQAAGARAPQASLSHAPLLRALHRTCAGRRWPPSWPRWGSTCRPTSWRRCSAASRRWRSARRWAEEAGGGGGEGGRTGGRAGGGAHEGGWGSSAERRTDWAGRADGMAGLAGVLRRTQERGLAGSMHLAPALSPPSQAVGDEDLLALVNEEVHAPPTIVQLLDLQVGGRGLGGWGPGWGVCQAGLDQGPCTCVPGPQHAAAASPQCQTPCAHPSPAQVVCGSVGTPMASVVLKGPDGLARKAAAIGTGPVDAAFRVGAPGWRLQAPKWAGGWVRRGVGSGACCWTARAAQQARCSGACALGPHARRPPADLPARLPAC